jgi:putative membrane protein
VSKTCIRAALIGAAIHGPSAAAHAALSAPGFVAKAGTSDLYETKSSKLVMTSINAGVRKFAHEMVTDHIKSTAMVKAAAIKSGVHVKLPVLNGEQKSDLAALTAANGAARDRLHVMQQTVSHQAALELMQDETTAGDKPALKTAAGKIVSVVQRHIEMLNAMPPAQWW